MASYTIEKRTLPSGEFRYKCVVRQKAQGKIIYNQSKTFRKKAQADTWGKKEVSKLDDARVTEFKKVVTLSTLLNMYFENQDLWNATGRTKRYVI